VTDVCDEHLVGWSYWQFKNFGDLTTTAGSQSEGYYNRDGTLQVNKVKVLARTYLSLTQGELLNMHFNTTNANFKTTFRVNTDIKEPTIIYSNQEYWYPQLYNFGLFDQNGKLLTLGNDYQLNFSVNNYAKVLVTNSALNNQILTIVLKAKYIVAE
jgi:hypothetical protein